MAAGTRDLSYEVTALARRSWWVFLLTGIAWLIFSLVVFRFNAASIKGIGYLAGVIFIVAGFEMTTSESCVVEP